MARSRRFLSTLAAVSIVLAACGGGSSDGADSDDIVDDGTSEPIPIEQVEQTFQPITAGKLTVCTDAPFEPFEFQDKSGKWTGFDMDLMTAIATRYGLTLEVSVQPLEGIWLAPKAGTCDVVASALTITDEYAESAVFSDAYFESYESLLVREADAETLVDLESLSGKTIGILTESTGETFAKTNATGAKLQAFDDSEAMYAALEGGQIDGVIHDFPSNAFRAVKKGGTAVSATFQDNIKEYGLAVAPDSDELLIALNESLNEFRSTGVYDEIFNRYFGSTQTSAE